MDGPVTVFPFNVETTGIQWNDDSVTTKQSKPTEKGTTEAQAVHKERFEEDAMRHVGLQSSKKSKRTASVLACGLHQEAWHDVNQDIQHRSILSSDLLCTATAKTISV